MNEHIFRALVALALVAAVVTPFVIATVIREARKPKLSLQELQQLERMRVQLGWSSSFVTEQPSSTTVQQQATMQPEVL